MNSESGLAGTTDRRGQGEEPAVWVRLQTLWELRGSALYWLQGRLAERAQTSSIVDEKRKAAKVDEVELRIHIVLDDAMPEHTT